MTDDEPRIRMLTYDVPLRPTAPRQARLLLPEDLTVAEAERLAAVIRAVAFETRGATEPSAAGHISTEHADNPMERPLDARQASSLLGMPPPLLVPAAQEVPALGPPHITVIKPDDSCWCGATIANPGEQSRAHRAATQEELADDPGRSE